MGDRVCVYLKEIKEISMDGTPSSFPSYFEIEVSSFSECQNTYLGAVDDQKTKNKVKELRKKGEENPLEIIKKYGNDDLYEFATKLGANVFNHWFSPDELVSLYKNS